MNELIPVLDPASDEALYMQLYRYVRDEITAGRIHPYQKLPSIRNWAAYLRISRTPVALAYEQLLAEGYIQSRARSGFFVSPLENIPIHSTHEKRTDTPSPSTAVHRMYHASYDELVLYDFGYGSIDISSFPLTNWRRLMNECLRPENSRFLMYGDLQGEYELREEIAAYLHQNRGVRCSPEQIVIGAGTYHSLDLLFQLLQDQLTRIAAEGSVNDGVKALLTQSRLQLLPIALEQDGIRTEDLHASGVQAVYVTPSHQFPFGMTMSISKRQKLLQWAKEHHAYIIENDYDGEFRYSGRPIPSLQSLDEDERVVYVGTFSKALTPSFRISYLVLPPALLHLFQSKNHSYDQFASPLFQKALHLFMASGDFDRHMRKMRRLYAKKHDVLLKAVRDAFGEKAEVIGSGSGLHILLKILNGMSETELIHAALQKGVKVYATSVYALAPAMQMQSTVLLGFGGLSEEHITAGVYLLKQAWS
ncbi:PLP-dependent aminotransferase family protein [Marinicrinis lubricantis]|uniref:PLP-dependent aminotransferase family protein n=1 Tax=Marinicrinis lubricantis TaxID=2086470 RepID=A0ABW1IK43_9BACL